MNVKMYSGTDKHFVDACEQAKVPPTHRQWRKWCRKTGSAYAVWQLGL